MMTYLLYGCLQNQMLSLLPIEASTFGVFRGIPLFEEN